MGKKNQNIAIRLITFVLCLIPHSIYAQKEHTVDSFFSDQHYLYRNYNLFKPYFISPNIIIPKDSTGYNDLNIQVGTYFQTNFDSYNELSMYINPFLQGRLSNRLVYSLEPYISNHNLWLSHSSSTPSIYNGYANFQQIGGNAFLTYELNEHFEVGAGVHGSYAFSNSSKIRNIIKPFNQMGGSVYTRYKNDNFSFTIQLDYNKLPEFPFPVPIRDVSNK
ncbi:hypothetical protein OAT16_10445 [Prolixibacteraceae bacterium]|nr:hypothetical protein [Prolixibacteraceae bacterium]